MRKLFISLIFCLSLSFVSRAGSCNCEDATLRIKGIGDFADMALHSRFLGLVSVNDEKHPDLFVIQDSYYPGCRRYSFVKYEDSVPVFEMKENITLPKGVKPGARIECHKGKAYVFWKAKNTLKYAEYRPGEAAFVEVGALPLPALKHGFGNFDLEFRPDGGLDVYFAAVTVHMANKRPAWRTAEYRPYDAVGVWTGGYQYDMLGTFSYNALDGGVPTQAVDITSERELMHGVSAVHVMTFAGEKGLVATTRNGGFHYFPLDGKYPGKGLRLTDAKGNALRNPVIGPDLLFYPSQEGTHKDVITFGEGGAFFMRCTGKRAANGGFVFDAPVALKEKNPVVYGGTLITPTVVDWDGDGVLDVVCGNSAGYILFFRNAGTDKNMKLQPGEYIKAGGRTILIQPGYGEDIQGIGEARWGYVGANVCDWNGDGHLDIITNDSRGKHCVFMGTENGLEPEHPIYWCDLPLHGTWRCRPGIGVLAGKTVYVTLDDDDDFHLYFRVDDYNLSDGGKLRLTDGRNIKANWLEAGGKGRVRFEVVDWDNDGVKDLLLATNKHNMIPADDPAGLPWSHPKELKGATILFMRNAGTEAEPVFEFPKQLKYKGNIIRLGHHGCGAAVGMVGHVTDSLPNIIAGDERGHLYLFERKNLTW